jgi:hypothetical protein
MPALLFDRTFRTTSRSNVHQEIVCHPVVTTSEFL